MTMTWTRLRVAVTIFFLITAVGCDEVAVTYYVDSYGYPPSTTYVYDDCDCDCGAGLWFCW